MLRNNFFDLCLGDETLSVMSNINYTIYYALFLVWHKQYLVSTQHKRKASHYQNLCFFTTTLSLTHSFCFLAFSKMALRAFLLIAICLAVTTFFSTRAHGLDNGLGKTPQMGNANVATPSRRCKKKTSIMPIGNLMLWLNSMFVSFFAKAGIHGTISSVASMSSSSVVP